MVSGSENRITVKEYDSIRLPGKNTEERKELILTLKELGKLEEVSDLDIYALIRILVSKEWGEKELDLLTRFVTKEKNFRLTIGKK